MKISDGFILREVKGANGEVSNVVITVGKAAEKLNGMITLNPTCAFIWRILEKGASREDVISKLIENYDVDKSEAETDVDYIISEFKKIGAIDD